MSFLIGSCRNTAIFKKREPCKFSLSLHVLRSKKRQDLISRYDEKSPTLITKEKNMIEEIVQVAQKRKESDRHDRISTNCKR